MLYIELDFTNRQVNRDWSKVESWHLVRLAMLLMSIIILVLKADLTEVEPRESKGKKPACSASGFHWTTPSMWPVTMEQGTVSRLHSSWPDSSLKDLNSGGDGWEGGARGERGGIQGERGGGGGGGADQEMMRMPKWLLSCSRNMKVSTVWGINRIPAGTRPCGSIAQV